MDHTAVAERFIAATFPAAEIAVIAGSTSRGERTRTSDIDLLLIGGTLFSDDRTSLAATYAFEGEVVEVFAYTPSAFEDWAQQGVAQHRPVIVHMLVEGLALRHTGEFAELRRKWNATLDAGPTLTAAESAARRYVITDALDDLRDAVDPLERRVLSSLLFDRIAELMLLADRRWIGTGKWLPRRLRAMSEERTDRLSAPLLAEDYDRFAEQVDVELGRLGGRVQAGHVR